MKRAILILPFFLLVSLSKGQSLSDIGVFGGAAMYMGDINPSNYFYSPSPAYGAFFRLNVNHRVALRFGGNYATVKGDPADFDRVITQDQEAFTSNLVDFTSQVEYNWLPYITGEDPFLSSLYVAGGIGYTIIPASSTESFTLPFGVGFKMNLTDRLSAGAEYSFRKTFTDALDNVENPLGNTLANNNDWYSLVGLFISYKFVKFAADCPAYK